MQVSHADKKLEQLMGTASSRYRHITVSLSLTLVNGQFSRRQRAILNDSLAGAFSSICPCRPTPGGTQLGHVIAVQDSTRFGIRNLIAFIVVAF
jgi:hypothetical protein